MVSLLGICGFNVGGKVEMDKSKFEILNSRFKRYGELFDSREQAEKWLEKRITSPIARTQFIIQETKGGNKMYKMIVYGQWSGELKLERILSVETMAEAIVLAQEKLRVCLGFEQLLLRRIKNGRYNVFNNDSFVGELLLVNLAKQ